jgi:hypothetical protein
VQYYEQWLTELGCVEIRVRREQSALAPWAKGRREKEMSMLVQHDLLAGLEGVSRRFLLFILPLVILDPSFRPCSDGRMSHSCPGESCGFGCCFAVVKVPTLARSMFTDFEVPQMSVALFTRVLGWDIEEVKQFLESVKADIVDKNLHAYATG